MFAEQPQSSLDLHIQAGHGRAAKIRLAAALAAATALSLQLGLASDAGAESLKCHSSVTVINDKPTAIKVTRFAYKNTDQCTGDKGCIEGLSNKKLSPGEKQPWPEQTLGKVGYNNRIDAVRIEYEEDTSGQKSLSDPWGKAQWSPWDASQAGDCKNHGNYTVHVK